MIEVRKLVHRYGETTALDGVSLSIPDGEFLVLAGANGSGKSTLIRHWNGLLEADAGEVLVDGKRVTEDLVAARTKVGMVFQNPRDGFVAATVGADVAFGPENLGLARKEIDWRVERALQAVNLDGWKEKRIDTLSGGEQERLAIAGALAMEPAHLVLDEPFTGLDEPSRQAVLERLGALSRTGTSVIAVTHDLWDVLDLADRLIVLSDGRVVRDGIPESVELSGLGVRAPC